MIWLKCHVKNEGDMLGYSRSIKENVKRMLYANSGNQCAICGSQLIYDNTTNASEICHIEAVNNDGARYNPNLTDEYVNSYENLILLCPTCHTIVDNKLNESVYTVEYLKRIKCQREQYVKDTMLNNPVIEPPILWSGCNIEKIIGSYDSIYDKKLERQYVVDTLDLVFSLRVSSRSILYGLVMLCGMNFTEQIDTQRLYEISRMDIYTFAETLMFFEEQKFIEETKYTGELDGYETEDGDFHLVKNDYVFKSCKGMWWLKEKGRLLLSIRSILGSDNKFYDFIVNKNMGLLCN